MPKLHLKRTPEEEAARQWRKSQKRLRKASRHQSSSTHHPHNEDDLKYRSEPPNKRYDVTDDSSGPSSYASPGPSDPLSSSHKVDYDAIRAELEEQRFREKMAAAFEDDCRLDSLEARLHEFAHVPDRWRSDRSSQLPGSKKYRGGVYDDGGEWGAREGLEKLDPRYMDDEEYAEWIRIGMYRKTHAEEYAENLRQKAAKAARRAQEKAFKAASERLENAAQEERRRRREEKESRRWDYAREAYEARWKMLLGEKGEEKDMSVRMRFGDIPWPVLAAYPKTDRGAAPSLSLEDLNLDGIMKFLLRPGPSMKDNMEKEKKERRDKLRETMLRFHPDKFEGRLMRWVREDDKVMVREAVGIVVRALNTLLGDA